MSCRSSRTRQGVTTYRAEEEGGKVLFVDELVHHDGENLRAEDVGHRETYGDSCGRRVGSATAHVSPVMETRSSPSMALFRPISFSDSWSKTISSAGVNSSLCRTRGRLDVTLPNVSGGVVTMELNTERTRFLGSGVPLRMDTIRGRCRRMSACGRVLSDRVMWTGVYSPCPFQQ